MKKIFILTLLFLTLPAFADLTRYGTSGSSYDVIRRATSSYSLGNNLKSGGRVRTYSNGKNVLYDQNDAASRIYKSGKNGSINVYDNTGKKVGTIRNLPANQGLMFDNSGNKTGSFRTYSSGHSVLYDNYGNKTGSFRSY